MKKLWEKMTSKPTLVSVISILIIILSIPQGIYNYYISSPSTIGWLPVFLLFIYLFFGGILLIDRALVKRISPIKLSIAEFLFFVVCFILWTYNTRTLVVDITDTKEDYVLIVENNGKLVNSVLNRTSFFGKEIKTSDNLIIVDETPNIELHRRPTLWGGSHYYGVYSYDKYKKVVVYSNSELDMNKKMSEMFVDSLIESKNNLIH